MKVYKTHVFSKWSRKEGITDKELCEVIDEICSGLIDADLGGGLIKKRMPKDGQGKRGGYRALLAFRDNHRALFLTGFAKNEVENVSSEEKNVFKKLSHIYLSAEIHEIELMCYTEQLIEVKYEKR